MEEVMQLIMNKQIPVHLHLHTVKSTSIMIIILFNFSKFDILTVLMLETEYSSFGVNTMPADAPAPKVTRASAGMVLAV